MLWDVDGTLVFNGGVSKEAYARGFELLTGRQIVHPVVTGGQTDLAIMRSLFTRHGLDLTNDVVARIPQVMTTVLDSLVPRLRERGRAMPGAREAIAALAQRPGLIQSVLTGNIAPNAYTKLATFGLHVGLDFEIGGYGSDRDVRAELVPIARRRASEKYGVNLPASSVVLIGDTPGDVEAGRLSGTPVIGVATGVYGLARLTAEGASSVLPDLTDATAVVAAVMEACAGRSIA